MSGFLGSALTAFNTVEAGASLLGGLFGDYPVTLGNFGFQDFEVPENINFGGSNIISIHQLCGGIRVFDVLGTEESDMHWTGHLLSADAVDRSTRLQAMRLQAPVQQLCFGPFNYLVLIERIDFVYHQQNHITYEIHAKVINNLQPVSSITTLLADVVSSAITAAQDIEIISSVIDAASYASDVDQALANVAAVEAAQTAVISAGSSAAKTLATAVQAAGAAVEAVQTTATNALEAIASGPSQGGGQAAASFVTSAALLAQQISQINMVQNYLGATQTNLSS